MTRVVCPTPAKHGYRSRHEAQNGAMWQVTRANELGNLLPTLYLYRCLCGRWHTTKMRALPGKPNNEIAVDVPVGLQEWAIHG